MAASITALATVVWSDYSEAAEGPEVMLADDLAPAAPVKVAKIEHKVVDDFEDELPLLPPKPMKVSKRKRLDFGAFEGY
jgi:hypothetical protein